MAASVLAPPVLGAVAGAALTMTLRVSWAAIKGVYYGVNYGMRCGAEWVQQSQGRPANNDAQIELIEQKLPR